MILTQLVDGRRCQSEGEETRHAALRLRDGVGGPTGSPTVHGLFSYHNLAKGSNALATGVAWSAVKMAGRMITS